FIAIYQDVTEKKRLEDQHRLDLQRQRLHVQQTPLGAIEWNPDFEVVAWNPAAESIFGYTAREAIGRHATFILPDAERGHVDRGWRALLAGGGGQRSSNQNLTKDGRVIDCEWYNTPLADEHGAIIGAASLVHDITESKRVEVERAEIERKLRETQKLESLGVL